MWDDGWYRLSVHIFLLKWKVEWFLWLEIVRISILIIFVHVVFALAASVYFLQSRNLIHILYSNRFNNKIFLLHSNKFNISPTFRWMLCLVFQEFNQNFIVASKQREEMENGTHIMNVLSHGESIYYLVNVNMQHYYHRNERAVENDEDDV